MRGFSIRPFAESDIDQTAELHRRGFQLPESPGQLEAYRSYFRNTYLESDSVDADCPSLVAVDDEGRITGFLGVVIRSMSLGNNRIRAALSSQFIVDPKARTLLAGIELLKRFLSGPQDLSFTDEAVERSVILWERLGGVRSALHSLHWILPLRPAALLMWRMRSHGSIILPTLAQPFTFASDKLTNLFIRRRRPSNARRLQHETQDPGLLIENLQLVRNEWALMPHYTHQSLEKLIAVARSCTTFGEFRSISLREQSGRTAGWYTYYTNPGGLSEVIQIAARTGLEVEVMADLIQNALSEGVAGLIGRMDSRFQQAIARSMCAVSPRQSFMLLHSRDPQLVRLISSGLAFLTRLEGEWCLRFH